VPKASGAITQGAKLYWSAANSNLTTTASGNTFVGLAAEAAASGDASVKILLNVG
jgi:predicted RecA/RadA family phage recombinase